MSSKRKRLTREQRDNRMFYMACAILAVVVAFGLFWVLNYTVVYEPVTVIDTTELSTEQAYYLLYASSYYPDGFEGFELCVQGTYAAVDGYYAVKVAPPTNLLEEGFTEEDIDKYTLTFEFEPRVEPDIQIGDTITVTGIFHLYQEDGSYYITLRYATVNY